jgi:phenylpropionate dioxygenase-like ring-hydroxylating dioxygenase large terminal subunit
MYHPITFTEKIPYDKPLGLKVLQKNIVVWRTAKQIHVMEDKCPHRNAKLSVGKILEDKIECGYHGWQFDTKGTCVVVPQSKEGQRIPRSCGVQSYPIVTKNGILYAQLNSMNKFYDIASIESFHSKDHFVTDYVLEANYDFWIQIENLLDPAHIHFVHNGFQGDSAKAKYIRMSNLIVTDTSLEAHFSHDDVLVPDIYIKYHAPNVVDVSIFNRDNEVVRRNIIQVTPIEPGKCRVLFRDVAYKKYLAPSGGPFTKLLQKDFIEESYQAINMSIVEKIMQQDIDILESQQQNTGSGLKSYLETRQILLTDSDGLIQAFRKWCKKNTSSLILSGYDWN